MTAADRQDTINKLIAHRDLLIATLQTVMDHADRVLAAERLIRSADAQALYDRCVAAIDRCRPT